MSKTKNISEMSALELALFYEQRRAGHTAIMRHIAARAAELADADESGAAAQIVAEIQSDRLTETAAERARRTIARLVNPAPGEAAEAALSRVDAIAREYGV